jgi:hypothetical protein
MKILVVFVSILITLVGLWWARRRSRSNASITEYRRLRMLDHLSDKLNHGPNWFH